MRGRRSPPLGDAPAAIAERTAKPTAATPSLSRLSRFDHHRDTRGRQPISRKEAITETGSVAAIRRPNSAAPIQLQPMSQCIPPATTAAAIPTPRKARVSVSGKFLAEALPVELERGFEHQRRKQDVEDEIARERQIGAVRQERDQEPGDDQPDDVRQAEPPREHRDQARDEEQDPIGASEMPVMPRGISSEYAAGLPCC